MSKGLTGISGVVLCGGSGTRLGGVAKALLDDGKGHTLLAGILARLTPQLDEVLISANRDLQRYRAHGPPVVRDATPGQGPLGGVLAAARRTRRAWLLAYPGDAPTPPVDLVDRLHAAVDEAGASAACLRTEDGLQPLHLLVRTESARALEQRLADGHRSARDWLRTLGVLEVTCNEALLNINTEHELARWRRQVAEGGSS